MSFVFVIPVVVIIIISVIIVKIASVALNLTGLDEKKAFFQALSAFTGTGFTTKDSELIVQEDIRRRIIMVLMILGNAGIVTVTTTLLLSFIKGGLALNLVNFAVILLAVLFLIKISTNKLLTRKLTKKIQQKLLKRSSFTKRPVEEVLRLAKGYGIAEVTLTKECVEIGKTLIDSSFRQKDILILAIERGASVIPTPKASDELIEGDIVICYGKLENILLIGAGTSKDQ